MEIGLKKDGKKDRKRERKALNIDPDQEGLRAGNMYKMPEASLNLILKKKLPELKANSMS